MKIQMLITADYASVDLASGKINILGAFARISTRQFPAIHPRLALVVKLAPDGPLETTEPRNVTIRLTDADGAELFITSGIVTLGRDENGNRQDVNIILELNQIVFPHPGVYEFSVSVDELEIGNTAIELVLLSAS
jgi:hypothetical protein